MSNIMEVAWVEVPLMGADSWHVKYGLYGCVNADFSSVCSDKDLY